MEDILFDIITREIVFEGKGDDSDFELTQNPSVQNGGIIMYGRAFNIYRPIFGIAVEEFINGNQTNAGAQMSRWQSQVIADGGKGTYKTSTNPNDIDFIIDVNYLQ
jgi:hypothetical protein